ncbi:MAG: hypothetical protein F4238_12695 [Gemmatimonadetes bacterium]|nr:hypothetical protein [Gemmatimonadota bacterium]
MTFNRDVPRPPGLEIAAIRRAIRHIEEKLSEDDFIGLYLEQANIFSALVGMFGTRALDMVSNYEKHRNVHTAQQNFPDLCRRGAPRPLRPDDCLECKASVRPWAIQSHYDHAGWYIVWCYLVDLTQTIDPEHRVVIWRVDLAFLTKEDWKYEGSKAGQSGGGRTHTFGVRKPATRLRGCAVYERPGIAVRAGKPVPINGID